MSLIKMMNDVLWGIERKKITAVIILAMTAAFDSKIMTSFWPSSRTNMV